MLSYSKDGSEYTVATRIPPNTTLYYSLYGFIEPDYLSGFTYLQVINVTDASSVDGVQIKHTFTYDSDMQTDFSDLRFVEKDGTTIPYWIESKVDGTSADIWLKLPADVTSFYMIYGNSSASAASDPDATFDFYDDAESGSVGDKWTSVYGAGTVEYSSAEYYAGSKSVLVDGLTTYYVGGAAATNFIVDCYFRYEDTNNNGFFCVLGSNSAYSFYGHRNQNGTVQTYEFNNGAATLKASTSLGDHDYSWHKYTVIVNGGAMGFYIDDVLMTTVASTTRFGDYIGGRSGTSSDGVYMDNIILRKYVETSPTITLSTKSVNPNGNQDFGITAGETERTSFVVLSDSDSLEIVPISVINRLYGGNIL